MWIGKQIALFFSLSALSNPGVAETLLPATGGSGGGPFEVRCPGDSLLRGVEIRAADDVDAIRPVCGRVASDGTVSGDSDFGPWRGGDGGVPQRLMCPPETPAVHALSVQEEGHRTIIVNAVAIWCGNANAGRRPGGTNPPNARWSGPHARGRDFPASFSYVGGDVQHFCPPAQVGSGLHGRHGVWLDRLGLICAAYLPEEPGRQLGKRGGPSDPPPIRTPTEVCQRARAAQARDIPALQKGAAIANCLDGYPGGATNSQNPCVRAKLVRQGAIQGDFAALLQACFASLPQ